MRIQTIEMYKRQSIDKQRLTKSHPFILSHALPGIVHLKISQRILVVIQLPIHTLERTTLLTMPLFKLTNRMHSTLPQYTY